MQNSVNQNRERFVGGSDIPVIMSLSPFKKRFDLLLEKAGYKTDNFKGNAYTEYGNTLEPKIRTHINKCFNTHFKEGKHFYPLYIGTTECEDISCRCHTDGENEEAILEIKTTHVENPNANITDYPQYLVQLLFYMMKSGKERGWLAVYDRPEDMNERFDRKRLKLFETDLESNRELCYKINSAVEQFLIDLEKVKADPFISEEDLMPFNIQTASDKMLQLEQQLVMFKEVEKAFEAEKEKLLDAMRKADIKSFKTDSGITITAVEGIEPEVKIKTVFDEDAFKEKHPKQYKEFLVEKETVTKGRKPYLAIRHPKEDK